MKDPIGVFHVIFAIFIKTFILPSIVDVPASVVKRKESSSEIFSVKFRYALLR